MPYRGGMDAFLPREIVRRSWLWRDTGGHPWLIIPEFTMIDGRLECVGMEIRSFLRDQVDFENGAYPVWWDGDPKTLRDPQHDPELAALTTDEIDAIATSGMTPPRPLLATVLRQLPLADVITRTRRQGPQILDIIAPWPVMKAGAEATAAWRARRQAAWSPKKRGGGRVARYTREDLEQVATIYQDAFAISKSPTKDVAEALGITRNVAAKLVMRCRAASLLEPAPSSRATSDDAHTNDQPRQRPTRPAPKPT